MNETMTRVSNGPRRRRMIRGTIVRIGELAMRYGRPSQLATLDCTSSRRSTVMRALPWATGVTTEYQRDSSSKRPALAAVLRFGDVAVQLDRPFRDLGEIATAIAKGRGSIPSCVALA